MPEFVYQGIGGLRIIPSDTVEIPTNITRSSGTNTSATASKLVDSGATFIADSVSVGDVVYNTTDSSVATVTALDSETTLSLSANIFTAGSKVYKVYKANTEKKPFALSIGLEGNVKVKTADGSVLTFPNRASGTELPLLVLQVYSTDTTATLINALC